NPEGSQICDNIHFGYVKGRRVAVAGDYTNNIGTVTYGKVELDEVFQQNSIPAYPYFNSLSYGAFIIFNFKVIRVDVLKMNNHNRRGIVSLTGPDKITPDELYIGKIEQSNCSLNDPDYKAYNSCGFIRKVIINSGEIKLHA